MTAPGPSEPCPFGRGICRYNLYARTPPELRNCKEDKRVRIVHLRRGIVQELNLGPSWYSTAGFEPLREFTSNPPVEGTTICEYIDDVVTVLPPERSRDMSRVAAVTGWLEEHFLKKGLTLKHQTSKVLVPEGVGPESYPRTHKSSSGQRD